MKALQLSMLYNIFKKLYDKFIYSSLQVLIHYRNYSPSFDEWIPRVDTHRFRQFGPDKKLKAVWEHVMYCAVAVVFIHLRCTVVPFRMVDRSYKLSFNYFLWLFSSENLLIFLFHGCKQKKKLWSVPSLREEDVDNDVHRFIAYNQAQNQRNINHGQDYEQYDYNHSHTRPSSGSSERKPGSKDSPRHHKHIKSVNDRYVNWMILMIWRGNTRGTDIWDEFVLHECCVTCLRYNLSVYM